MKSEDRFNRWHVTLATLTGLQFVALGTWIAPLSEGLSLLRVAALLALALLAATRMRGFMDLLRLEARRRTSAAAAKMYARGREDMALEIAHAEADYAATRGVA